MGRGVETKGVKQVVQYVVREGKAESQESVKVARKVLVEVEGKIVNQGCSEGKVSRIA